MYVDSHVHLHAYADPTALLDRANAADVEAVVAIPVDAASSLWTLAFAAGRSDVYAAVGLHPSYVQSTSIATDLDAIADLAATPAATWIGEIGLDSVEFHAPLDLQIEAFRFQLDLARQLDKPVNLHFQGAVDLGLDVLTRDGVPRAGAVFHYFHEDWDLARKALDLGLYLSVGKPVTRSTSLPLRDAITRMPLDRLLLETDSYPLPGRSTEPADIGLIARSVAELRQVDLETVAQATTANFRRLVT